MYEVQIKVYSAEFRHERKKIDTVKLSALAGLKKERMVLTGDAEWRERESVLMRV